MNSMRAQTEDFALFGNIVHTPTMREFETFPDSWLVCRDGKVEGVFGELPERFAGIPVHDYGGMLIIPGLCDTHLHAPQYAVRGLGMDLQLLDWLNTRTFPEEALYADLEYAETAYGQFADALKRGATTRASIFATVHVPATLLLMRLLERTGLRCLVGKVNMNRNSPDDLTDGDAESALANTEEWIQKSLDEFTNAKPIITPRFVISCNEKLLIGLGRLAREYKLPVQSHLSENKGEIEWVKELCPWADSYGDVYEIFDLFGDGTPTVMAHCVHSDDYEREWIKKRGVLVSHCPSSNANLSSGAAPIRRFLDEGALVALGTDIAGGFDMSIFRAMSDAIQVSKLRACFAEDSGNPLTVPEAFYLGTKGASPLFGRVGSFEAGYEFDAVALDDSRLVSPKPLDIRERVERAVCLEKEVSIKAKYVAGEKVL